MKAFRELKVWQKAHDLIHFGNLAEGCGRNYVISKLAPGDAEFARYCSIAMGSASELEYHLLLASLPET